VQGPETYLNDFAIQLPCAVDPTKTAILDPEHRAFVNHEVYYFSSAEARTQFEAAPYRFTGRVTDPVSLTRFEPSESSPMRTASNRLFYFESGETVATFDHDPEKYSTPKPTMAAMGKR
jgi:YHS domain-containing protein